MTTRTARRSEPGRRGGFGIMRAMDDVEVTGDEVDDLLSGDDHGEEEHGCEWVN